MNISCRSGKKKLKIEFKIFPHQTIRRTKLKIISKIEVRSEPPELGHEQTTSESRCSKELA